MKYKYNLRAISAIAKKRRVCLSTLTEDLKRFSSHTHDSCGTIDWSVSRPLGDDANYLDCSLLGILGELLDTPANEIVHFDIEEVE